MSQQPHSNNFGYRSYGGGNIQQEQGSNVGMRGHVHPAPAPRGRYANLPPEVRLPPTMQPGNTGPEYNRPQIPPRSIPPHQPISNGDKVQRVSTTEVLKLLEEAERENEKLRDGFQTNNQILSAKISEMETFVEENKKLREENELIKLQLSNSTNQFFEARVAVLGFKCRVMQLQAQSESKQPPHSSLPAQPLGPHEINAQIGTLTQENKQLLDNIKSMEAALATERQNTAQLQDRNTLAEQEADRCKAKVEELDNELKALQGRLGEAQNHSYVQHSTREQLSQQLKSLETEKRHLQSQYQAMSNSNTSLQSQVQTLKASEKELARKLHQAEKSQSSPAPVPKPRTNVISPQVSALQSELDALRGRYDSLHKKYEEERERRNGVELSLSKKGDQYQELLLKYNHEKSQLQSENESLKHQQGEEASGEVARLTQEVAQLKVSEESSIRDKEDVIKRLMAEKADLQTRVASVDKQKQTEIATVQREMREEMTDLRRAKDDLEATIANLEEKLRLASSSGVKAGSTSGAILRRLNDALGKNKELETKLANQKRELEDSQGMWDKEKQSLQQEVAQLQEEGGAGLNNIAERLEYCETEMVRLESVKTALTQENSSLKLSLEQARKSSGDDQRQLAQQLDAKDREVSELQHQLREVNNEKEKKHTKLLQLTDNFSEVKDDLQHAQDRARMAENEKKRIEEANAQLSITVEQLRIDQGGEKKQLEETLAKVQEQAGDLFKDYQSTSQQLQELESENERLELVKRRLETDIQEKNARITKVENERKTIQDRVAHMDAQLSMFREDFEREREAREAAVKVKNMLDERLGRKEAEVKDLRDRINQQAQNTLRSDSQDNYDSPSPNRVRSGEQQPGGFNSGGSGDYRRSGEVIVGGHSPHFSREQQPAPPLPPRERNSVPHQREYVNEQQPAWTQHVPAQPSQISPHARPRPMTTEMPRQYQHQQVHQQKITPPDLHHPQHPAVPDQPITPSIPIANPGAWRAPPPDNGGGRNDFSEPSSALPQRNNLSEQQPSGPPDQVPGPGEVGWVGPGEVINKAPPSMACPICQLQNFQTQTDLELHCAQCT